MKYSLADGVRGGVLLVPFVVAVFWLRSAEHVPFDTFVLGSGSWGIGCILKMVLYHGVVRRLRHDSDSIVRVSVLNGVVSGATELGAALLVFSLVRPLGLPELLAFGVGIGAIEALLVATPGDPLQGTGLEGAAGDLQAAVARETGARGLLHKAVLPCAERYIATGIHVGTRGLAYIFLRSGNPLPLIVALGVFIVGDGLLGYRLLHEGRLENPAVLERTYLALLALALFSLGVFLLFWKRAGSGPAL